jgi:hypothetical protein
VGYESADRRKFPRADFSCRISIFYSQEVMEGRVKNIGAGGVLMSLDRELMRDIPIKLELFIAPQKTIHCTGHVVWVLKKSDNADPTHLVFDTGVQFDDISETDREQLRKLVERITLQ